MRNQRFNAAALVGLGLSLAMTACGGNSFHSIPANQTLTVNSTNPAGGVAIAVSPADVNGAANGTTSFTRTYLPGTSVTLTAPATAGGNNFSSWTGCASTSGASGEICTVAMIAGATVTANYTTPATTYTLTVNSSNPASGVPIGVSSCTNNVCPALVVTEDTSFTLNGASDVVYTLSAPATANGNSFSSWTGCPSASGQLCTVAMNANATVTANYTTPVTTYTLTVNSTNPASGVTIDYNNPLNNVIVPGTTSFSVTEPAGTTLNLTAPATAGGNNFSSWTGCTSASAETCNVTLNANATVAANYIVPAVAVTPNPASVTIGTTQQFTAYLNGVSSSAVTWTVAAPSGSSLSPGAISSTGLYTTPYPAPVTVTVTATSTADSSKSATATVTLSPPATAAGPALSVDAGSPTHAISPDIYGMDAYLLHATTADTSAVAKANITIDRWGGDSTERYNYQLDTTSSIADWYFENQTGNGGDGWPAVSGVSAFDALVESNAANGIKTLGTVPVLGWVARDSTSCSYPVSTYPDQVSADSGRGCGDGLYPDGVSGCTSSGGCDILANDPTETSTAEPPPAPPAASAVNAAWADATWAGGWTEYLVNKFGQGGANNGVGGVAIYDLDNEPSWWDANDRDVHPSPFTYDEVTNGGIGTALAIKTADPTAEVSGPVMDYWWDYFYSKKDVEDGWSNGSPCWEPWSDPVDREAHGGIPFIEYYLQQFADAQTTYGVRLLDYVDLHTYFAADYPAGSGNSVAFTTAGNTGEQQARLNSTRAFWDPTYTDPNYTQPNYITDANYYNPATHGNCNVPLQAPELIPMMQTWVANDYPGTKTAIDEYNWGGMESINGALAQADILGIFGREGLDLATLWPTTDPSQQIPGMMAFAIYRNYDGNKSTFGDTALTSVSADQSRLSVYGAVRSSDNAVTVVVINKTYGDLTATLTLDNLTPSGTAQAFLYSNANLNAIVAQPAVTVTPPPSGSTNSTIANYTFPAQSITLFVVPQ